MVKRVLVTTALEDTWPETQPVLFLGEWCRLHARQERWSAMDAEVVPYHWDDRDKLFSDYQYLNTFYNRLLGGLAVKLNQIHSVDHSERYWRVLIGPWLVCFVQVLFDRWTSIHKAISEFEVSGAIVRPAPKSPLLPHSMADYMGAVLTDEYNEQLCAAILQQFTDVACTTSTRQDEEYPVRPIQKAAQAPRKSWLKRKVVGAYDKIADVLTRDTDAVLFLTYLSFWDEKKLMMRLRQMPRLWRTPNVSQVEPDALQRKWRIDGQTQSAFENCALALVPQFMPTAYLEGYKNLIAAAADLKWPLRPKFVWTSTAHNANDVFKAWVGEKTEQGTRLVIGQHGGQYGVGRWVTLEGHETTVADAYLSWGWSDATCPRVIPVGQFKAKRPLGVDHAKQSNALLITAMVPRYSYYMRSIMVARQWLDYFDEQCGFIDALPDHIRDAMTVRLYAADYGWGQKERWQERYANLKLDSGQSTMNDLISQSRVVISTYNATTYLETFTMDVPTVMFWKPEHWELRDAAIPFFEDLKRVGIFHETPQSAAHHIANIWDDVDGWWQSPEVRDVITRFTQQYCHLPDNLLASTQGALKNFMEAPGFDGQGHDIEQPRHFQ